MRSVAMHYGLLMLATAAVGGCVERTMTINTDPQGARVVINDEEVGVSPAKVSFLWYGDYDIILRKRGYETVKTHHRLNAPWYQVPPVDLVAETMIIGTIHDDRVVPTFVLNPAESPPVDAIIERAVELQGRALFEDSGS
jgi:hypothetical protein